MYLLIHHKHNGVWLMHKQNKIIIHKCESYLELYL